MNEGPLKRIETIECDRVNVNTILVIFVESPRGNSSKLDFGSRIGGFCGSPEIDQEADGTKRETLREFTLPGEDNLFKVHFTHNHTIVLEMQFP